MKGKLLAIAALVAVLAFGMCACGQQGGSSSGGSSSGGSSKTATDPSSWKTLGEGLAFATESPSYGYDGKYFVCVFNTENAIIRAVAEANDSIDGKFADLDYDDKDYLKKFTDIVGNLKLISAEDISGSRLTQADLDAIVGKTAQELYDDGFVFESYYWYGGEQTGASLAKGYFNYEITFDGSITEEQSEDGGEVIKDYKAVEVADNGNLSNAALEFGIE